MKDVVRIGDFFVLDQVAGSNHSTSDDELVYVGADAREGGVVEVRIIRGAEDELSRALFRRQAEVLSNLVHPFLRRVRQAKVLPDGRYVIAMDSVDPVAEQKLPPATWVEAYESFVEPFLEAIGVAHVHGMQHGSLDWSRIAWTQKGPCVTGFEEAAISRAPAVAARVALWRESPYAPPQPEPKAPYADDVHSAAVVIIRALRGQDAALSTPSADLEYVDVPAAVRELLSSCLAPEASLRPATGYDLAFEMEKIVRQEAAEAGHPTQRLRIEFTPGVVRQLSEVASVAGAVARMKSDTRAGATLRPDIDGETGVPSEKSLILTGMARSYSLTVDTDRRRLLLTRVSALSLALREEAERPGNPADWRWTAVDLPDDLMGDPRSVISSFDQPYPEPESVADHSDLFPIWTNLVEARRALSRNRNDTMIVLDAAGGGRRWSFQIAGGVDPSAIGRSWEALDPRSARSFGRGVARSIVGDRLTIHGDAPLIGANSATVLVSYDRASSVSLERQRNAILSIKHRRSVSASLRDVLLHPDSALPVGSYPLVDLSPQLDQAKRKAVELALAEPEVLVVHGPPGTGKTRIIAEIVVQILARDPRSRILIASQTHGALDNAIEAIRESSSIPVIRLAGRDDSVVNDSVRDSLLAPQVNALAQDIRAKVSSTLRLRCEELGLLPNQALAALLLAELEPHIAALEDLNSTLPFDESVARRRADLAHLRDSLAGRAQRLLGSAFSIPPHPEVADIRAITASIFGDRPRLIDDLEEVRIAAAWLDQLSAPESLASTLLTLAPVVAGTCTGFIRDPVARQVPFDVCLVDEASRATLSEALIPMSRARRTILVGDTRQLPPLEEDLLRSPEILETYGLDEDDVAATVFQRMVDLLPSELQVTLTKQYRMVPAIGDLISDCFYESSLTSVRQSGWEGYREAMGAEVLWLDSSGFGQARRELGETSYWNPAELDLVLRQLERLDGALSDGRLVPPVAGLVDVLIIAPYSLQVEQIRQALEARTFEHITVQVSSIDGAQGLECDVAIVSLTRSNDARRVGFLGRSYWRRVNVALSRARYGLMVVGDADFIRRSDSAFADVLSYIEAHPLTCALAAGDG